LLRPHPEVMAITQRNFVFAHVFSMRQIGRDSALWIMGPLGKHAVEFGSQKLAPHVYELTFVAPLTPGQYGIIPPGATTTPNLAAGGTKAHFSDRCCVHDRRRRGLGSICYANPMNALAGV
jgi:hypothetical protein